MCNYFMPPAHYVIGRVKVGKGDMKNSEDNVWDKHYD